MLKSQLPVHLQKALTVSSEEGGLRKEAWLCFQFCPLLIVDLLCTREPFMMLFACNMAILLTCSVDLWQRVLHALSCSWGGFSSLRHNYELRMWYYCWRCWGWTSPTTCYSGTVKSTKVQTLGAAPPRTSLPTQTGRQCVKWLTRTERNTWMWEPLEQVHNIHTCAYVGTLLL